MSACTPVPILFNFALRVHAVFGTCPFSNILRIIQARQAYNGENPASLSLTASAFPPSSSGFPFPVVRSFDVIRAE